MVKSLVQSVSTYESGNAVDTEGNGTITLGNKNVSGTYSNSWQGVTPSILQEMWILLEGCLTVKRNNCSGSYISKLEFGTDFML